jgi:hypothetical protein
MEIPNNIPDAIIALVFDVCINRQSRSLAHNKKNANKSSDKINCGNTKNPRLTEKNAKLSKPTPCPKSLCARAYIKKPQQSPNKTCKNTTNARVYPNTE